MNLISKRRALVLVQVLAFGLILASVFAVQLASTERAATGIPEKVGDQLLMEAVTGSEAVEQVSQQLHGVTFDLKTAYVADYSGPSGKSTVWLAEAKSLQDAESLFSRMTAKISAGNPVFRDLRKSTVDGRVIYSLTGLGQRHFYFLESSKLVWVATTATDFEQLLGQALQVSW